MLIELNEKEYGVVKKVLSTINEAAITMKSVNKTLNKSFGPDYNVVADTSPRKCYVQYYDFDAGIYVTGDLKVDRLTDLTLEEWIEETKKVAEKVKKSKIKRIGEAYDAVTDRNNIKDKRQDVKSYYTKIFERLKKALAKEGVTAKYIFDHKGHSGLRIGHFGIWEVDRELTYGRVGNGNYDMKTDWGTESEDDASYKENENDITLKMYSGLKHVDTADFDVRNTPSMVKWILDHIE